ncbi:ABC transporter ATP-binding protein [Pyrococcus yayanosii]|uniref:ABC-type iron(III)-siderophore transport system, ATPase component n=1 Tax=Pyrococcus yayanosii (strain CH1 / JCM 16557) TaxID=529709 RepID=F8AJF3_PYRYC|nr:ABC transporter ATP-binding protein [Pyrococcus yayanosii]AEH25020.1 ABC-type iron(III)-siderophore transport system, ATPase component [Pyrococcus yayanosii CH1]
MLCVEGLSFSYGQRRVLKSVNLSVERGLTCLLGPNGAGKTTLLKCIAGILRPETGRVIVDGRDITGLPRREVSKLITYSPQEFSSTFPYTVFQMVLMGRNPYINPIEGPRKEDEEAALQALRTLGLEKLKNRPFTELSGGERRLVMIARAVAQGGRVLLFDEPTSFPDFKNKYEVMSIIKSLSEKKPVLVSLHDPNLALTYSERAFLLKNGKIIAGGRAEEVITPQNLSVLYDIPVERVTAEIMVPREVVP